MVIVEWTVVVAGGGRERTTLVNKQDSLLRVYAAALTPRGTRFPESGTRPIIKGALI